MLETIQKALINDIHNSTRTLSPFLDTSIENIHERIDIFVNNRMLGQIDYLKSVYPVCAQIMGDDFFNQIAADFVGQTVQTCGNRHEYGEGFSRFLEEHESTRAISYIKDIAKIEWAHFRAFLAYDATPIDLDSIGKKLAAGEVFGLRPTSSASIISVEYNALEIWQAHQKNDLDEIELICENRTFICWRGFDDDILFFEISQKFAQFLGSPNLAFNFTQTIEAAIESEPNQDEIAIFQKQFAAAVEGGYLILGN